MITSAATFANFANKQNILDILDIHDQVDENRRDHDSDFPTVDYLRSVTYEGRDDTWGNPADEILGEGMDNEASEAISRIVDEPDSRLVWVTIWGGPRDLAQVNRMLDNFPDLFVIVSLGTYGDMFAQ